MVVPCGWLEVISGHLQVLGFSGLWIDEAGSMSVVRCYLPESEWRPSLLEQLKAQLKVLSRLFSQKPQETDIAVKTIEEEDWASKWLPFFVPFKIGNVWIRSSRSSVSLQNEEREIIVDPGQAFGTGHHETTRLCMEAILRLRSQLREQAVVLDLGTGTGILAMFAFMKGLKNLIAVDQDPAAVDTARKNLAENRMSGSVQLFLGSLNALKTTFDLVVANLSFSAFKQLSGTLARRLSVGGQVVASGFLGDEVEVLSETFSAAGLRRVEVSIANEWACGVFKKAGSSS